MATEYTVRCAFNALDTYKKLPKEEQTLCKDEYELLKKIYSPIPLSATRR